MKRFCCFRFVIFLHFLFLEYGLIIFKNIYVLFKWMTQSFLIKDIAMDGQIISISSVVL